MKRIFSVSLKKIGNVAGYLNCTTTYEVIAPTAKQAIDKATTQFKKDEGWAASVVVESLIHRGPAV